MALIFPTIKNCHPLEQEETGRRSGIENVRMIYRINSKHFFFNELKTVQIMITIMIEL